MEPKTVHQGAAVVSAIRSDRGARAFVWSVWLIMILVALVTLARYGRNIPLAEDWYFVSPITGNEPNLVNWLWAQNNEHRVPLPRLILLTLLKVTHGDFRAGMVFNVITLGVLAFVMIRVAQHLRGGRTSFADAFFPVALLHLGNWPNLFWGWQFSLVLSTTLTCALLLVLVSHRTLNRSSAVVIAGICLVLLPLCGATGLIFVPLLTLWFLYCGVLQWHAVKVNGGQRWISSFLIGTAVIALCLMGLYFVGYKRPTWNPPNPGIGVTLKTTAKFLALGFGPVAAESWTLSVMVAFGFLLPSAAVAVLAVLRHQGLEKHRALGILLFFGNLALFALAIGWGRAGYISKVGLPMRYVLLAVPTLCTAYFVWELYGSSKLRTVAQRGLLLGMCLLLPFNTVTGLLKWGNWYRRGMEAVEQDLLAGNPPSILAEEHRDFLIHWWDENQLAEGMQMLQDAGIGPFAQIQEEPVNSESSILK